MATFYPAGEYHQDYFEKNPIRHKYYRYNSGCDQLWQGVWGRRGNELASRRATPWFKPGRG